jgi:EXLDI family protein
MEVRSQTVPNKMIYVSEADAPVFERARELAGGSLSAVIARALRQFIQIEEAKAHQSGASKGEAESESAFMRQNFRGRRLARQTVHTVDDRLVNQIVSQNTRGKLVLYTREIARWSSYNIDDWAAWDWDAQEYRLETYDTLEALKPLVSSALYEDVVRALAEGEAETTGHANTLA